MVLSQRCLAPLCHFLYSDYFLVLTVYCLHQRYLNRTMPVGLPGLAAACFILGVLLYSTVVRAEYPDIGSNFFPAVLSVIMVFWIGAKMRNRKQEVAE